MVDEFCCTRQTEKPLVGCSQKVFLPVCCGIQLQPLQPLQPFCNLGNAIHMPSLPAVRTSTGLAGLRLPGTASASSLQPRPQPVPMDCWARGGAAARPHLSATTTVPQSMACQSTAAGNLVSGAKSLAVNNETNDTAFGLNRHSAPIGVAALNYFSVGETEVY
eukprot:scaffold80011_cov50-Phaeocystis_antarctica.AAC.3